MKRIPRELMFMQIADKVSERSTCERAKVGAIAVVDNRIVSMGYGGAPSGMPHCTEVGCEIGSDGGCIRTTHAEINCIVFAARKGVSLENGDLYVTLSPCYDCAKAIVNSGISKIFYGKEYRKDKGLKLLQKANIETNHIYLSEWSPD